MTRWCTRVGLALLPASVVLLVLAFRFPALTEHMYTQSFYPWIAHGFAAVNRLGFSVAEPLTLLVALVSIAVGGTLAVRRQFAKLAVWTWSFAGLVFASFLVSWGLNYARPPLRERLKIDTVDVTPERVVAAGLRAALHSGALFAELPVGGSPTRLPMSFSELNRVLDDAYEELALAGDPIGFDPAPAKPLWSSELFSWLGISGIYVPFTGEPSVNVHQPDPSLPVVVAHEKAHQRGITDEGEANFAAFLACSHPSNPDYVRYAAYLFATRYLLGAASHTLPTEELRQAWAIAGDGPIADTQAIYDFWAAYDGAASEAAASVNDLYLESMRVPQGIMSYGTVVELLVALDDRGALDGGSATP